MRTLPKEQSTLPNLPVLLTRPRASSEALAARLRAAGVVQIEISPLLDIRYAETLPPLAEALILTSPNGVDAYAALGGPPGLPTWCVGPRTSARAAAHGLAVQGSAPDAVSLAARIPRDAPPLLHLRGAHQRGDLSAALRDRGLRASDAMIYDQVAVPLSASAAGLVGAGPIFAPLYSPRTARLLAQALDPVAQSNLRAICISPAVCLAVPFQCYALADTPDAPGMEHAILSAIGG